jgi:hypothetical protein
MMSQPEREIVGYVRLGCSLWGSALAADVPLGVGERWLELGRENPNGPHGVWAREVNKWECRRAINDMHNRFTGCLGSERNRQQHGNGSSNGNGSNGNGQHSNAEQILRIQDL